MEKLNNIYMVCSCEDKQPIPAEIEKMYFDQYGHKSKKKFFRSIRRH